MNRLVIAGGVLLAVTTVAGIGWLGADRSPQQPPAVDAPAPAGEQVAVEVVHEAPESVQEWLIEQDLEPGSAVLSAAGDRYLVVAAGQRPTGGYEVELVKAERRADGLHVQVRVVSPPADAMVTQALSNPFIVLLLPDGDEQVYAEVID